MDEKNKEGIIRFFDESFPEIKKPHKKIIEILKFLISGVPKVSRENANNIFHEIMTCCKILCTIEMELSDLIESITEVKVFLDSYRSEDGLKITLNKTLEKLNDHLEILCKRYALE